VVGRYELVRMQTRRITGSMPPVPPILWPGSLEKKLFPRGQWHADCLTAAVKGVGLAQHVAFQT